MADSGGVQPHLGGRAEPAGSVSPDASRLVFALQRRGVAIRDRPRWAAAMSVKLGIEQAGRDVASGPRTGATSACRARPGTFIARASWALAIEPLDEVVEPRLLLQDVGGGRSGRFFLQRQMHPFMPAVLLRMTDLIRSI